MKRIHLSQLMMLKRLSQGGVIVGLLLVMTPASAYALVGSQQVFPGASNASDYQPPTGNPQNDVGNVSQGQNQQNNLQRPGAVNQTELPVVTDLRVVGVSSQPNQNTTKIEVTKTTKHNRSLWLVILISGLAVSAVVYVVAAGRGKRTAKKSVDTEIEKPKKQLKPVEPEEVTAPEVTKPKAKKTKPKPRKSAKKSKRRR